MKTIIRKDNYCMCEDEYQGYAVFKAIYYPSEDKINYWQQISKWYFYKKCCEREFLKRVNKDL